MPEHSLILAFDFGTCRIGVAIGQQISGTARPLTVLAARDGQPDWNTVAALLKEWKPGLILVGDPINMDETVSEMSLRARKFARRLEGRFGIPVQMVDERLSSMENRESDRNRLERAIRRGSQEESLDAWAATTLCEDWLRQA